MTNYERIKNLTVEEMAQEIKAIANWNRKEKRNAEKNENFYVNWLKSEAPDDKCKVMGSNYCKQECPIGKEARERNEETVPRRIDVTRLNRIAEEHGMYGNKVTDYLPR